MHGCEIRGHHEYCLCKMAVFTSNYLLRCNAQFIIFAFIPDANNLVCSLHLLYAPQSSASSQPCALCRKQTGGKAACPEQLFVGLPISVLTDSYKAAHYAQYPDAKRMVAVRAACMVTLRSAGGPTVCAPILDLRRRNLSTPAVRLLPQAVQDQRRPAARSERLTACFLWHPLHRK